MKGLCAEVLFILIACFLVVSGLFCIDYDVWCRSVLELMATNVGKEILTASHEIVLCLCSGESDTVEYYSL